MKKMSGLWGHFSRIVAVVLRSEGLLEEDNRVRYIFGRLLPRDTHRSAATGGHGDLGWIDTMADRKAP